jgi:hypothetical protein
VIVNVCATEEFEKVRTFAESPALAVPEGVIVIDPVKGLFGVTVKLAGLFIFPEDGPVKVKVVAIDDACGVTEFDGAEAMEVPTELTALTVKV